MSWYDRTQGSSPAHDAPPATSVPASSGPAPAGPAPAAPAAAGPTAAGPRRRSKILIASGAVAVAAILGIGAVLGVTQGSGIAGTPVAAAQVNTDAMPAQPGGAGVSPWGSGSDQLGGGGSGSGQSGSGQLGGGQWGSGQLGGSELGGSSSSALGSATNAQQIGIVAIDTELAYQGAEAAGTGMVLTDDGEILTNNHVIAGSTSITVTIVSSGQSYPATVVGTNATDDIAVLQLSGASNLDTANFADGTPVNVGDAVTGVGNAGGVGGIPSASPGTVTALNQTITTQAESGAASETLRGLIETDADIQAGDSGGPLFNADDEVVGIDTAAQSGGVGTAGYAIPIASALSIAQQIHNGEASENIVIGLPAFIGVQVSATPNTGTRYSPVTSQGALISGVISGTPAAEVGITAGDTITAIDGTSISNASALSSVLAGYRPGENVTITWVGTTGAAESAALTLASGPAL